jgi:hypothetical protein
VTTPVRPVYRASPTRLTEEKPLAAPVLIAVGGFLVLAEGLLFGEIVIAIAGALLLGWALLVRHEPHHHVANGITILLFVFLSFAYGSGGFYLGGILAGIGGILSFIWKPRPLAAPLSVKQ